MFVRHYQLHLYNPIYAFGQSIDVVNWHSEKQLVKQLLSTRILWTQADYPYEKLWKSNSRDVLKFNSNSIE
jgi:hypothetical protein